MTAVDFDKTEVFSSLLSCLKSIMHFPRFPIVTKRLLKQFNLTGKQNYCRFCHFSDSNLENNPLEALILRNTVVSRNHLTPELLLRLITSECKLWYCKGNESPFLQDPFWGIYWPGGQALGRYILDKRELFYQKNVLDIGSGSGACALAAAISGARLVLANDTDPVSISAICINSRLNNLKVHTYEKDLIGKDIDSLVIKSDNETLQLEWNIILLGDMFYDSEFSCKLFIWLSRLVKKRKQIFIGDPGRHALKELEALKNFGSVVKVAEYDLCDNDHNGFSSSSVYRIECSRDSSNINPEKNLLT